MWCFHNFKSLPSETSNQSKAIVPPSWTVNNCLKIRIYIQNRLRVSIDPAIELKYIEITTKKLFSKCFEGHSTSSVQYFIEL